MIDVGWMVTLGVSAGGRLEGGCAYWKEVMWALEMGGVRE